MPNTRLPKYETLQRLMQNQRVWNALIPRSAVDFEILGHGVRYLHATKGWKFVSAKRFAVRGVL